MIETLDIIMILVWIICGVGVIKEYPGWKSVICVIFLPAFFFIPFVFVAIIGLAVETALFIGIPIVLIGFATTVIFYQK